MTSHFPQRLICSAVASAMLVSLSACLATGPVQMGSSMPASSDATPLTPAEQQMRSDSQRFNETVLGGVLVGVAAGVATGVLAGVLTGGNSKEVRNTAIAGGVIGGTVGGISGYNTAKKEQAGREEIRSLQATTADLRQANSKLQTYLDSSSVVLQEGRARLSALSSDVKARRLSTEQAEAARQREERNIASMTSTLAQAKKAREQSIQATAKLSGSIQDRRDLDAEIVRLNKQIAQLEAHIAEYNRALAVSRA